MQENSTKKTQNSQENRKHKDSLFVDYFSKDRDWKQHFLSLYNALHGTNLQVETTRLERVNLEQVLYMDYYNDIAVLVNGQFIMMIEHQSTINPNMPLRLLEYVSRIYGNLVDSKSKFSDQLIPLAKPEFFVFYTGKEEIPPESYLYLSDAFKLNHDSNSETTLELVVKVCKIRGRERWPKAKNCDILNNFSESRLSPCETAKDVSSVVHHCSDLQEYTQILELIDEAKTTGKENPLTWAIQEAVKRNIMKDYLERKGGEALSILTAEYDFDTAIAVKQEEAYASGLNIGREEGISIGLERGLEQGAYQNKLETARSFLAYGDPPEKVAFCTGLPLETVQGLMES